MKIGKLLYSKEIEKCRYLPYLTNDFWEFGHYKVAPVLFFMDRFELYFYF